MTGIERLRELVAGINPITVVFGVTMTAYDRKHKEVAGVRLRDFLADIADQIDRELREERSRWDDELCDAQMDKTCVMAVYLEMNRHVLGHEGMEDSPVARWARELRDALGGEKHDPAEDVSMSAHDLLPQEDREAIAWVREHGGLEAVRRRWECLSYYADPVPRSCMEKRLARLQRQIDESHAALRRRNQRIALLASEINRAHNENRMEFLRRAGNYTAFADEVCKRLAPQLRYMEGCSKNVMDAALDALDRRLMPEGMEWLVEVWPRFEDGWPVRFLDDFERYGDENSVSVVTMYSDGSFALNFRAYSKGERVNRPAPKVLDADGEEIREKRDAIAWVREHGGLERVKAQRFESMPRAAYERKKAGFLHHIAECETALRRRNERIKELNRRACDLTRENAELRKRAMPEGMCWPVFEDSEPVRVGDFVGDVEVRSVVFRDDGILLSDCTSVPGWGTWRSYKEPIKRPTPKVLDADGAEIRVGDTVYDNELGIKATVTFVHEGIIDPDFPDHVIRCKLDDDKDYDSHMFKPSQLTHRGPVLAADGKPLEAGQTVYAKNYGYVKCTVLAIEWVVDGYLVEVENEGGHKFRQTPDEFTHERPESKCRDCAHWQKDPTADKMGVCWFFYHEYEGQDCYAARRADIGACEEFMPKGKELEGDA